jgi:hypothetical protein
VGLLNGLKRAGGMKVLAVLVDGTAMESFGEVVEGEEECWFDLLLVEEMALDDG